MSAPLPHVCVVGAGPAGLAAAERLLAAPGIAVTVLERMPSPARKFLLAGRGGLNLTHSEPADRFATRFGGSATPMVAHAVARFPPGELREWSAGLGQATFVGSSGRVFPESFKASPLVRAWLRRLERAGARLLTQARFTGFSPEGALLLETPQGKAALAVDATVLALGGASWPRLGADGSWVDLLAAHGVAIAPLAPTNVGVSIRWSEIVRARFPGAPLKRIAIGVDGPAQAQAPTEAVVTEHGLEGTGIYARSAEIGERLEANGRVTLTLDLRPDLSVEALAAKIAATPRARTVTERLRRAGLAPAAIGLMREDEAGALLSDPSALAGRAKGCRLAVTGLRPMARAISTRGGIVGEALTPDLMLRALPGVFAAGEMLDWHAPTGGYLIQGAIATGRLAADGVLARLGAHA